MKKKKHGYNSKNEFVHEGLFPSQGILTDANMAQRANCSFDCS